MAYSGGGYQTLRLDEKEEKTPCGRFFDFIAYAAGAQEDALGGTLL